MEPLELNQKIREFFIGYNFKEVPSVPIFTSSPFYNPNLLSLLNRADHTLGNYLTFSHNLDVNHIPYLPSNPNKVFTSNVAGILNSGISITRFSKNFFHHVIGKKEFFWEAREKNIEYKILGITIYGWELLINGKKVGICGYLNKLASKQISDIPIFSLNFLPLYSYTNTKENNFLEYDFPKYLMSFSSKRVLFELFDNYFEEFIFCVRNDLKASALIFMVYTLSIYELLTIRGFISKTEKIGYDRKINLLFQKCIET